MPGIAQLIASRALLALALLFVAVIAAAVFLLFRRQWRLLAPLAAEIVIAALTAIVGDAGVLVALGRAETRTAGLPDDELTVLISNT